MLRIGRVLQQPVAVTQKMVRSMSSTPEPEVVFSNKGVLGVVRLNRPRALNALTENMVEQMTPQLLKWQADPSVGIVLIKGTGGKAFCAGGDVLSVTKSAKSDGRIHREFFIKEYTLNHLIGTYKKPYVAFIQGYTMGGGVGVSVHGTFRVATETTVLSMPETALGLFPDVGGSYFLSRLQGKLGLFLGLSGYRLKGADAVHAGLATHYIETKNLDEVESALAAVSSSSPSVSDVDAVLNKFSAKKPSFSLDPHLDTINTAFDAQSVEEIVEKLGTHSDEFSQSLRKDLLAMSPTSLKVTLEQIKRGAKLDLAGCLKMENQLGQHFIAGHDFHEGCRAILVDKDRNPKWKPAKLSEVSDQDVQAYFEPFEDHPHPKI